MKNKEKKIRQWRSNQGRTPKQENDHLKILGATFAFMILFLAMLTILNLNQWL